MKHKILNVLKIILIIVLFIIPISLISLNSELIIGDEIWNFQNIAKLVNGAKMYVDCNIIVTPIFYLLGYCFVKLITGTILGFRIYNVFIFLVLLLSSFALFRTLKIERIKAFIYTLLVFLFVMPYISVGANYNVLDEAIFIFGLVLFFNKDKIKFYNLYQGIVIFACIFTKQNIGLYYLMAIIIGEIIIDKKESVNFIIREMLVALVCILMSFGIMYSLGCFRGFLNYTILGMGEFTTGNISIGQTVELVIIGYLCIAVCSYILGFLVSIQNKEIEKNIKVLSIFSIFLNISILPIANLYHTSFAILINLIIFIYLFEQLLLCKLSNKVILIVIATILYIAVNCYGVICVYRASKNIKIDDIKNVYYSSNMNEELNKQLEEVVNYIKQKENDGLDVICITADSALYMTYLNRNHSELDLCFKGNLGWNGTEKTIEKLKEMKDTVVLINTNIYGQEISEIKDYIIKQNYGNIETVECLNAYRLN